MEPLSPRSTNVKAKGQFQDNLIVKAVQKNAIQPSKPEKDLPAVLPQKICQPSDRDGNPSVTYNVGRLLGKGGFAACYLGQPEQSTNTGSVVALKVVKSAMSDRRKLEKFRTELQIHSKMSHPNIVQFHQAFAFEEYTYIVLEICSNGSLMDMLRARKCLTFPETRRFIIQICGAIKYMHDRDVLHRDLKMSNIFIDDNLDIKLGDLGLAAILVSEKDASAIRRTTLCGTPNYIAPEILNKSKPGHDARVDIWSLGIIIFAMLDGATPFAAKSQPEIYRRIKARDYDWSEKNQSIPENAKDLVASILVEADKRPSPDEIVLHEFLRAGWVPGRGEIDKTSLKQKPRWSTPKTPQDLPSRRNDWRICCESSGVGYAPDTGDVFPSVGGSASVSIYQDIKYEAQLHRTPEVPLRPGDVYTRLPPISSLKPNKRLAQRETRTGHSAEPVEPTPTIAPQSSRTATRPSHASNLREQMRPKRAPARPSPVLEASDEPDVSARLLEGGAKRKSSSESTKQSSNESTRRKHLDSQRAKENVPTGALKSGARRAGVPASQSNKTLRSAVNATLTVTQGLCKIKRTRSQANIDNNGPLEGDGGSPPKLQKTEKPSRNRIPATNVASKDTLQSKPKKPTTLLSEKEEHTIDLIPGTSLADVLNNLVIMEGNIGRALGKRRLRVSSKTHSQVMPYVIKWVDYTNKFGMGYTLNDGTSGCVFSPEADCPSICILVREGEKHAQSKNEPSYVDRDEIIPQNSNHPVEFFENQGENGIGQLLVDHRAFRVLKAANGRTGMQASTSLADGRRKRLAKLWSNFASYMANTVRGSETGQTAVKELDGTTRIAYSVRFFQRFGDVTVYGFTDGHFQLNFQDHSKMVLSKDGLWCEYYHLSAEALQRMEQGSRANEPDFDARTLLSQPLSDFFHASKKKEPLHEIHQFEAKLAFAREVFKRWIASGSLGGGCVDGDDATALKFDGISDPPKPGTKQKLIWATCGAVPTEQSRQTKDVAVESGE